MSEIGAKHGETNSHDVNGKVQEQSYKQREQYEDIYSFYDNAVIFITGATGFLGKVLVEKLLRSCSNISAIYILVRAKRGLTSKQRYKDLIKNNVFAQLRAENPKVLEKLICLSGDVSQPYLGLSEKDRNLLLETTTLVFHSAATVKFNEGLKDATNLNALGTERLMDFCTKMKHLKSVVHVSTAYCNPGRKYVGEKVYPPIIPMEKEAFLKCVKILPKDILDTVSEQIRGSHPNTYTLTKSIAEQIVMEYSKEFPVSIIRPSIITAAIEEPCPGWVDNIQGITGIMMEIGRGTISSILGDKDLTCDIIPVDVVVNTIIGAAWFTGSLRKPNLKVLNCTSGQINPISWQNLGLHTVKWARVNPSKYTMLYPKFSYRQSEFVHKLYEIFFHFLPALVFDMIIRFQGGKPIMMKIARQLKSACHTGKFFALREWIFEVENQKRLAKEIEIMGGEKDFNCSIANLDYENYIGNYMLGIRKYILRDGEDSLPNARSKLRKLLWIRGAFQVALFFLVVYIVQRWIP